MAGESQPSSESENDKVAHQLGEAALRIDMIRRIADSLETEYLDKLESLLGQVLPVRATIQDRMIAFGPLRKGRVAENESNQIRGDLEFGHLRRDDASGPILAVRSGDALFHVDPLSIRYFEADNPHADDVLPETIAKD